MSSKKFIITSLSLIISILIIIAGINIVIDPLFQYHTPWFGLKPVISEEGERYQYAGIAKNFEFDNAILGNSLCENFKPSDFDKAIGGKTQKLTIAGSSAKVWSYELDMIKSNNNHVSSIISNIDPFSLNNPTDKLNMDLPVYLYDSDLTNDVSYLYNTDVFLQFTLNTVLKNTSGNVTDFDTVFIKNEIGEERVLSGYNRNEYIKKDFDAQYNIDQVNDNIDLLISYIESMPDTHFYYFLTPFSILYWDSVIRKGELDWWHKSYINICDKLLKYDNVSIFFWTDKNMLSTISNLDLYMDIAHYGPEVCSDIAYRIGEGIGLLSIDNYSDIVSEFFDYVSRYNYDSIFSNR